MKENIIMGVGKNEIFSHILLESDTLKFNDIIRFNFVRHCHNFTPTIVKYPFSNVEVVGVDRNGLRSSLESNLIETSRKVGVYNQYRDGYLLIGVNVDNDIHEVVKRFRHTDTIPDPLFSDGTYKVPNILNTLQVDLDTIVNKSYDFVLVLLLGDGLDFYNGYREYRSQTNPNLTSIKQLDDRTSVGSSPLCVLEKYGTSLNVRGLEQDCYTNRFSGNRPMSKPINYYMIYVGKLDVKSKKFVEDYFTFNTRERNVGNMRIITNFNTGDLNTILPQSIQPFSPSYIKNPEEIKMERDGWSIMYGIDPNVQYNIFNTEVNEESTVASIPFTHQFNGYKYKLYEFVTHNIMSDTTIFNLKLGTKVSEL